MTVSAKSQRRALITGATGFIGSRLAKRMHADGWEVHLLLRSESHLEKIEGLSDSVIIHRFDGSTPSMFRLFDRAKPDIVFHLAAQFAVTHNPENVEALVRSNILFGTQLLEAMARAHCHLFVNTGSFWQHDEGGNYHPVDLYAATKQAFEAILIYYRQSAGIQDITLKLFDVYGPGDTRNKLFQLLQQTASTGQVLDMTLGEQHLDLVYVDDVIQAYIQAVKLLLADSGNKLRTSYAVSSSRLIPLKEVVALYEQISGHSLKIRWGGKPYRNREIMRPWRGPILPGWKPAVNLENGIRRMISENKVHIIKTSGEDLSRVGS